MWTKHSKHFRTQQKPNQTKPDEFIKAQQNKAKQMRMKRAMKREMKREMKNDEKSNEER